MVATVPVTYPIEVVAEILRRIELGETLTAICKEKGMPDRGEFNRWVIHFPEVRTAYAAAREASAIALEEEALDAGRSLTKLGSITAPQVNAIGKIMDQLRWSAERRNAKLFGQRGQVAVAVPIHIETSLDLGQPNAPPRSEQENVYQITAVRHEDAPPQKSAKELMKEPAPPLLPGPNTRSGGIKPPRRGRPPKKAPKA